MLRNYLILLFGAALCWACQPEDELVSNSPELKLTYSTDTVSFDTLLSEVDSRTRRFRIFNPHPNAINISQISTSLPNSPYTLTVNGEQNTTFNDVLLLGQDSLLVLVETRLADQDSELPLLVRDSVSIRYNQNQDFVKLVAWGQDASFLNGSTISDDAVWTAGKPYVINEFVLIDSTGHLTVEAGARVFIENGGALFVQGTLTVQGTAENPVIFRNTRFDENYQEAPGQWDAIYFLEGSKNNTIDFATISNGTNGLRVGAPDEDPDFDLVVSNTIIANMSVAGILGFTSDIYAYNTLIYNCGQYLVGNFAGGNYRYEHCTFSNFPSDFFREDPSVQFSDVLFLEDEALVAPLNLRLTNNIIWGNLDEELLISDEGNQPITLNLTQNIIRSANPTFDVNGNLLSRQDNYPGFTAALAREYELDCLSVARNIAIPTSIISDLNGLERDSLPDIGAYEWFPANEN